jgi:hypothetical protein
VEGGHRAIERLGHPAHRGGADLAAEQRQQRLADLAGRQSKHEAGKNDPVDLGLPAGIGAQHPGRAVAPRPRHPQLDVAERGQQMARVVPVAPVRGVVNPELGEMAVDCRHHLLFDDGGHRQAAQRAIAFAPLKALGLHRLHHLERHW